jgi:arginyl-tRNA synthetase
VPQTAKQTLVLTQVLLNHQWRSGGAPGTYTCRPDDPAALRTELDRDPAIATVTLSNGFITMSLTREALANTAVEVARAGQDCVTSGALRGRTVLRAPKASLASAQDWEHARAALAAELTATLAITAGATPAEPKAGEQPPVGNPEIARALAFAGGDAVRFTLARMRPGTGPGTRPGTRPGVSPDTKGPDPAIIARHVLSNPAYAVRYAHAAAVAVLRWAGIRWAATDLGPTGGLPGEFRPRRLAEPGELALLDALSWLPERVATAARRGRPDVFARYLEALTSRTIDIMSTTNYRAGPAITAERLWLADAARTGLAAGLGLLGINAPDRI